MTDMITDQAKLPGGVTAVLERPGARLVYEVAGDGPAVVFIHGFGLDMRMWDPQAGPLAARFRVVRYDCRGFGASGPLDPAVSYTHAGDLVALLDHLDIGDAVLAGLSFGGRVALQAALAAPDRVRGLALLDAVLDKDSRMDGATVDGALRAGPLPRMDSTRLALAPLFPTRHRFWMGYRRLIRHQRAPWIRTRGSTKPTIRSTSRFAATKKRPEIITTPMIALRSFCIIVRTP